MLYLSPMLFSKSIKIWKMWITQKVPPIYLFQPRSWICNRCSSSRWSWLLHKSLRRDKNSPSTARWIGSSRILQAHLQTHFSRSLSNSQTRGYFGLTVWISHSVGISSRAQRYSIRILQFSQKIRINDQQRWRHERNQNCIGFRYCRLRWSCYR